MFICVWVCDCVQRILCVCVNSNKTKPKTVFAIHCRWQYIALRFYQHELSGWLAGWREHFFDLHLRFSSRSEFISMRIHTTVYCCAVLSLLPLLLLLSSSFRAMANFLAKSDFMFAVLLLGNVCNKMSAFNVRTDLFIYLALQSFHSTLLVHSHPLPIYALHTSQSVATVFRLTLSLSPSFSLCLSISVTLCVCFVFKIQMFSYAKLLFFQNVLYIDSKW